MNTFNRLQFRNHEEIFNSREDALRYICQTLPHDGGEGLAVKGSPYTRSLYAEPTVLRYMNTDEEGTCGACNIGPHVILVIGSQTNDDELSPEKNTYCIIDIDKTEEEIAELEEAISGIVKSFSIITQNTDTLNLYAEKTEDGTILSGDVKTPPTHIFDGVLKENSLLTIPSGDMGGKEGLFIYVGLTYDPETEAFVFAVSGLDEEGKPVLKKQTVSLPNNYLTGGSYDIKDESIHLGMKNGEEIVIDCKELIYEWEADPGTSTPIVLNRERVRYDDLQHHHHADILTADVRIDVNRMNNILMKSINGRSLYVDGMASNIWYNWNGERSNVEEQLNKLNMIKISPDHNNILQDRTDGYYAEVSLDYVSAENKLIFKTTNVSGEITENEIQLNTVDIPIENIIYNPTTEELIILWKNDKGEIKRIVIPIGEMIQEWEVLNPGHNVTLNKVHQVAGKDQLSADVNIYGNGDPEHNEDNILEDRDHSLYVKGTADNIKYENVTVKDALDNLDGKIDDEIVRAKTAEEGIDAKIDTEVTNREAAVNAEKNRAEAAEAKLDNKIGSGFTEDPHENVTFKFEALSAKTDAEIERAISAETALQAAIEAEGQRAQDAEAALDDKIDAEITRSTEKDNEHDTEIAELSADTKVGLKHVVNIDKSINVVEREGEIGKEAVVKVNLSTEVEDERKNIIKLNSDGLFSNVDLNYIPEANKLIFHTSNGEPDKEIQLESMSSIISIEYNPTKEAIVITYLTNGHEIKTVEIPVGDLINEWRVEDGHPHAVQLEKVRVASGTSEQDVLKASVIITESHDDNILTMDNGALYVPANTEVTEALNTAIEAETTERIEADRGIEDLIESETTRAQLAEAALSAFTITATNEEKTRAMGAEGELRQAIQDETARANAADELLQDAIDDEVARSTAKDNEHDAKISTLETSAVTLEHSVENERTRALSAETELSTQIASANIKIDNEITRSTNKDIEQDMYLSNLSISAQTLSDAINGEASTREIADTQLQALISGETAAREANESIINAKIDAEIERSKAADSGFTSDLNTERDARLQGDAELAEALREATLTFDDTTSIDFTKTSGNVVTADVKLQQGDNIIKVGQGLYATAHLSYDTGTNKIKLTTSAGEEEFQLAGATVIDNLEYDSTNKELVITYHDGNGGVHTVRFGVSELFNEWDVQNPSENSAVELTKTPSPTPGGADKLSGRILLTNLDDNALSIVNNGLYVSSSDMSGAKEIALCAKNEVKVLENVVIGHQISEECGSGYTYEPNTLATYISGATSFNNADFILDQNLKRVDEEATEAKESVDCVDGKANALYELFYGVGHSMPNCGSGVTYQPYSQGCVIKNATSFMEADMMLNDQLCEILEMWVSGETCTTKSEWVEDGSNKKMQVDVKLSRGNAGVMSDDEIIIENITGDYIDPTNNEFTDTNALRIVCLSEGGVIPSVSTPQNGVYLSNIWDCGLYYGPSDTEAKARAEAAGYNTNYSTDEDASASGFNYMNNVRQNDSLC